MSIERGAQFQQDVIPGTERADSRVYQRARQLPRVAEDMQLSMLMPQQALINALDENKFKNTFEASGAGIGMGSSAYMINRRAGERALFDIPEDAPGSERPVYGILREKDTVTGEDGEKATPAPVHYLRALKPYGNALVDIRPPKKNQNVTYTETDSLNSLGTHEYTDPAQVHAGVEPGGLHDDDYTEVQWHDRPEPRKDIQGIHFRTGLPRASDIDFDDPDIDYSHQQAAESIKQYARSLRISGLRAPVHHWQEKAVQQPSLFNRENVGLQWDAGMPWYEARKWTEPTTTKYWEHKQV